jgi:signal transduction histidine kinase
MELLSSFHQMITSSYLKTTLVCLCLSATFSLIPVLIMIGCHRGSCEYIHMVDYGHVILHKSNSSLWLIAAITTAPMIIDFIFDLPQYIHCAEMHDFGIYRFLLVILLVVPNIVMYYTLESNQEDIVMRALQYSLTYFQVSSLFSIVLVSLFCSKWKTTDDAYKNLKIQLGNNIMYFLVICVISRIFFVIKVIFLGNYKILVILSQVIEVCNTVVVCYCIISIICYDLKFFLNGKSSDLSFNKLSDLLHSVAIIVHGIGLIVVFVGNSSSYFYIIYFQIALTLSLTIIPSQVNLLRAEAKGNKVKTKLNTIRYVSHEMRTPLNISILGSKIALDTLNELTKRLSVMNIQVSTSNSIIESLSKTIKRLTDMCNTAVSTLDDVLTFDKLDEKKLILEKQAACPLELVREVISQFEDSAQALKIEMRMACLPEGSLSWLYDIEFTCDRAKIIQILRYLLSNAIKYTPSQGRVTVVLENYKDDNEDQHRKSDHCSRMVRISVKDTGRGISQENQKSIFTQFVETDTMAIKEGHSTGLGLWICKSKFML